MNYFEFYDLAIDVDIDQKILRQKFLQKSKRYHPDFYTLADEDKQSEILALSSLNNEAYATLSDDDKRLRYILEHFGALKEGDDKIPQDFLMEMMELNEQFMDVQMSRNQEGKNKLLHRTKQIDQQLYDLARPALKKFKDDPATYIPTLKDYYLKKRYIKNLVKKMTN